MKRLYSSPGKLMAIVVASALVLSACGGSSDSNSTTSQGSAGSTLTGTPIIIGAIGADSGPTAASTNQGFTVAPAWGDWVNANGGNNGHPVQVELADDGFDPAKAQAAAKDLIDTKHVDALSVISDQQFTAYADYAVSQGIPVISGQANSTLWYKLAGLYTTPTDTESLTKSIPLTAKNYAKANKFGFVYCTEVAACSEAAPVMQAAAEAAGLEFTSLAASQTAPDYTAECLKLQQEEVDFVLASFSAAAQSKFVQDCQAQGYNPTYGVTSVLVGPQLLALTDFTAYGPGVLFSSVADAPVVQIYTDAMKKYAKDDNWQTGSGPATWTSLEMLRKAMGTITGDVTPASVTAALNNVKDEDLDGLLPNKVTYTAGQPLQMGSRPCYFAIEVKDGKLLAPSNLDPQCPA